MDVGLNYPWPFADYGANLREPQGAWLKTDLPDALAFYRAQGVSVVRFFLYCRLDDWGTQVQRTVGGRSYWTVEGVEKPDGDTRHLESFLGVLRAFVDAGLRLIPVLVSFEAFSARPVVGHYGGRAAIIDDPVRGTELRELFFEQRVRPLLRASLGAPDTVLAWDVYNEPGWNWQYSVHGCRAHSRTALRAFLTALLEEVSRETHGRIGSTVGHACYGDLAHYPTGTLPQYHYYSPAGPLRFPRLPPGPPPLLGELSSRPGSRWPSRWLDGEQAPWPSLRGADLTSPYDAVLARLRLAAARGHQRCLLWPDVEKAAEPRTAGRDKLSPEVWRAVRAFREESGSTPDPRAPRLASAILGDYPGRPSVQPPR